MGRRRFDHLFVEICLAVGVTFPRYPLWLRLKELGLDPEALTRQAALAFCDGPLEVFLAERGFSLSRRRWRRLRRSVHSFDPAIPSPYEQLLES